MYCTRFKVEGTRYFPTDMLRHDRCCPYGQSDVSSMEDHDNGIRRQVELVTYHTTKTPRIERDRWRSFGWIVVPTSVRTERASR